MTSHLEGLNESGGVTRSQVARTTQFADHFRVHVVEDGIGRECFPDDEQVVQCQVVVRKFFRVRPHRQCRVWYLRNMRERKSLVGVEVGAQLSCTTGQLKCAKGRSPERVGVEFRRWNT